MNNEREIESAVNQVTTAGNFKTLEEVEDLWSEIEELEKDIYQNIESASEDEDSDASGKNDAYLTKVYTGLKKVRDILKTL